MWSFLVLCFSIMMLFFSLNRLFFSLNRFVNFFGFLIFFCFHSFFWCYFLNFTTIYNFNFTRWLITLMSRNLLDFHQKVQSFNNFTKYNMLSIQPRGLCKCKEELWTIGIRSWISHGKISWTKMFSEVLIVEVMTVDIFSTGSVISSEITCLHHELFF